MNAKNAVKPTGVRIVAAVAAKFRSFGGGMASPDNPISMALQNAPAQFAAGVDIADVVHFVREQSAIPDLLEALRDLIAMMDKMDKRPSAGGGVLPVDKGVTMHRAREALAKAEG